MTANIARDRLAVIVDRPKNTPVIESAYSQEISARTRHRSGSAPFVTAAIPTTTPTSVATTAATATTPRERYFPSGYSRRSFGNPSAYSIDHGRGHPPPRGT
jgi:hypothetical protein